MNEERSRTVTKNWLEKLTDIFSDEPQSREELLEIVRESADQNLLDQDAISIIEGALKVSDMQVRDIMIPRSQMDTVYVNIPPQEYIPDIIAKGHSRYPVEGETPDEILGILLVKDLLPLVLESNIENINITDHMREAIFVPESKRLNVLLKEFRMKRYHMAIVVDEYGGIAGLVTIEDVLEEIVGEIEDETDVEEHDANIRALENNSYLVRSLTPIEDFNDHFNTSFPDDHFDTIGGIVTHQFGRLPNKNESTVIDKFSFKVLSSDGRRVRLLEVKPLVEMAESS